MAVAYVQRLAGGNSTAAVAFVTLTLAATPAVGNAVVLAVYALRVQTFTISDSKGGTWTRMGVQVNSTLCQCEVWARDAGGSALLSGDTVTASTGGAQKGVIVLEASGLGAAPAADRSAGGTGSGTALATAATGTTAVPDELAVAIFAEHAGGSDTLTWAGGFTGVSPGPGNPISSTAFVGYRVLAATGTVTASGTLSTSRAWTGLVVTLQPGAAQGAAAVRSALGVEVRFPW